MSETSETPAEMLDYCRRMVDDMESEAFQLAGRLHFQDNVPLEAAANNIALHLARVAKRLAVLQVREPSE